jgi:aspartate kinase
MLIMKFGGTSVADAERILALGRIVAGRRRESPVVVVSALGGVTDRLLEAAEAARTGHQAEAQSLLAALEQRHLQALDGCAVASVDHDALRGVIGAEFTRLRELLRGVALLRELTARTRDAVAAAGEILSSQLVAAALRGQDLPAVWVDPRPLVRTDASFGAAQPDEPAIAAAAEALLLAPLTEGRIPVTGGFAGSAPDGQTTTLGRGGSDYSAALLGAALRARSIEIWTDVDGILTADPRLVDQPAPVAMISYAEAAELAFFGARVLHPATLRPAVQQSIPVWIKNSFNPGHRGTEIRRAAAGAGVRAIAARRGCAALFIANPRMLLAHGYAAKVFSVFERHTVAVDVIATSEVSISVTVDEQAPLERLQADLSAFAELTVVRDLAVVTVVGQGLRGTAGIAARLFTALRGVNVVMISQGASDTNMTFVVAAVDAESAVRRLHDEFFPAGGDAS